MASQGRLDAWQSHPIGYNPSYMPDYPPNRIDIVTMPGRSLLGWLYEPEIGQWVGRLEVNDVWIDQNFQTIDIGRPSRPLLNPQGGEVAWPAVFPISLWHWHHMSSAWIWIKDIDANWVKDFELKAGSLQGWHLVRRFPSTVGMVSFGAPAGRQHSAHTASNFARGAETLDRGPAAAHRYDIANPGSSRSYERDAVSDGPSSSQQYDDWLFPLGYSSTSPKRDAGSSGPSSSRQYDGWHDKPGSSGRSQISDYHTSSAHSAHYSYTAGYGPGSTRSNDASAHGGASSESYH